MSAEAEYCPHPHCENGMQWDPVSEISIPCPVCMDREKRSSGSSRPGGSAEERTRKMKLAMVNHRLTEHPHLQAEAIALHYTKLAGVARELSRLVDYSNYPTGKSGDVQEAIKMIVADIKREHEKDFGIELNWPND